MLMGAGAATVGDVGPRGRRLAPLRCVHVCRVLQLRRATHYRAAQWGVGKAIANAERIPVVLPMYAWGNNAILPQGRDNNLLPEVRPLDSWRGSC